MKKCRFLFVFFFALFSLSAKSEPEVAGLTNFGPETIEQVKGSGLIKLNRTIVKQLVRVTGSLLAQSARIGSIEVFGEANLSNTTVTAASTIVGTLRAQGTTFEAPLSLCSLRSTFTASKLAALHITKDDSYKGKQVIELKQGTTVDGPIHFESGKGEIHLFPGSHVYGTVTGGRILKKS